LKLEDVATPKPSGGEVLLRIHAAGVNPYDTYMRADRMAPVLLKRSARESRKWDRRSRIHWANRHRCIRGICTGARRTSASAPRGH
jgi:hypothetical protein